MPIRPQGTPAPPAVFSPSPLFRAPYFVAFTANPAVPVAKPASLGLATKPASSSPPQPYTAQLAELSISLRQLVNLLDYYAEHGGRNPVDTPRLVAKVADQLDSVVAELADWPPQAVRSGL